MWARLLGAVAVLVLVTVPAGAGTLGGLARARGAPSPTRVATADQPLQAYEVLDDAHDLLVVYVVGESEAAQLHAAREWTTARLDWPGPAAGPPRALAIEHCHSGLAIDRRSPPG